MGKIKNFVTGLFSKKKAGDEEEIIQIEPIEAPDRDFIENESRYDTPDYQAFLQDMGYIDANEKGVISSEETVEDIEAATEDYTGTDEDIEAAAEDYTGTDEDIEAAAEDCKEVDDSFEADAKDPSETPVCGVDQDFIDEGVAELGVNDVWTEEED